MYKKIRELVAGTLCVTLLQMSLPLEAMAGEKQSHRKVLMGEVFKKINAKYEYIADKIPADMAKDVHLERKERLGTSLQEEIQKLKSDEDYLLAFKDKLVKISREEAQIQKQNLLYQLHNLRIPELDQIAEILEGNKHYQEVMQEYQAAFTKAEKANALTRGLHRDIDQMLSIQAKRLRKMPRETFIKDIQKNKEILEVKGDTKQIVLTLIITSLAVIASGLITWGIATAVYRGKYKKAKSKREDQFDARVAELEQQLNDLETRLSSEQQSYLAEQGFTLQTCGNYELPDSIICNRYNYQKFSGNTLCTVSCYRNNQTGKEALHQAPVCSSPFIPGDCYDPTEYTQGYDDGYNLNYDLGYDDGYHDGDNDGYDDGADDGQDDGDFDGDDDGYDDGYNLGFSHGYDDYFYSYESNVTAPLIPFALDKEDSVKPRFEEGYEAGKRDFKLIFGKGA